MWPVAFEDRLQEWNRLRHQCVDLTGQDRYDAINDWWFRVPMVNRHLKLDNIADWPDPWDLLSRNRWCDLARGLGMLYTVMMVDPDSRSGLQLAAGENSNLVLADHGKYILNWAPRCLLNIQSVNIQDYRLITGDQFYTKIGNA